VRRISGRNKKDPVQRKLIESFFRDTQMSGVDRIERSTKDADPLAALFSR
jgi:hypothetical protein